MIKYLPPHLAKKNKKTYDTGGYFPSKESALNYVGAVKTHIYHKDRIRSMKYLLRNINKKKFKVLDFGCGDGYEYKKLNLKTKSYIGIDVSQHMIDLASKTLGKKNNSFFVGGVEKLKKIKSNSIDLILAFEVIGYFKEKEIDLFFKQVRRILKKNCYFATTNGNELFDLFALNYHTKTFFKKYFNQKESHLNLLLKKNKKSKYILARRFNPLEFNERLKVKYNLLPIENCFASLHKYSPEIGKILHRNKKSTNKHYTDSRIRQHLARNFNLNPNKFSYKDKWKCLFLCSIFGALFKKEI